MSSHDPDSVRRAVARHSLPEVAQAIAQGGAVDALDREGRTPLFYAAMAGELEIIAELIRHGANVNAQDKRLETPLHFAPASISLKLLNYCSRAEQT